MSKLKHQAYRLSEIDVWEKAPKTSYYSKATKLVKEFELSDRFAAYSAITADYASRMGIQHLHAHFAADTALTTMIASKLLDIPFSFTAHAYDLFIDKVPAAPGEGRDARLRRLTRHASRIVTISEFNRDYLLAKVGSEILEKIVIIRCGIDPLNFTRHKRVEGDIVRFLCVGRFVEKKGHERLLQAFRNVADVRANVRLRLAGDGPLKPAMMELCETLGLSDKVEYLGSVPSESVMEEMRRADVFVLHSVTAKNGDMEGVPVSIMEASATGLPVVSTRHSGIPELVLDGISGLLTDEADTQSFSQNMLRLADNAQLRLKLGEAGCRHVRKNYDLMNEATKLAELFACVSAGDAPPMQSSYVLGGKKADHKLDYRRKRKHAEVTLANGNYEHFYTAHFGFEREFYQGKVIADIGCGRKGSLDWAYMAARRIGIDPLAERYKGLGADVQAMEYIASNCEAIPVPKEYCDVVMSFNSLDGVADLDRTISEIKRILKPGGTFLLITQVNRKPIPCEQVSFSWDVVDKFKDQLGLLDERHYEKSADGVHDSIHNNLIYDHSNKDDRYGILSARFVKQDTERTSGGVTGDIGSVTARASVIICTHNRGRLLRDSIRSVQQQDFPPHCYEIVIVDNNSKDNTRSIVEEMAPASPVKMKYVFEENQGLSLARNAGINNAEGDVIVFTDDDIDTEKDWLRELVTVFNDPGVSCAGGPIRPVWPFPKPDWLTERWQGHFTISEFRKARETGEFNWPDYPWGANIAFRKDVFQSIGMFPTNLGRVGKCLLSNEEIELCRKIEASGKRIAFAHKAVIHHKIHPERIRRLWLYHRTYWQGRSNAVLDINSGTSIFYQMQSRIARLRHVTMDNNASDCDRKCINREIVGYIHQLFEGSQVKGHVDTIRSIRTLKTLVNTLAAIQTELEANRQRVEAKKRSEDTDLRCLDIVCRAGPITAGELAERTGLTTGAITGVIDRLENAGFVRRAKDPTDRRRVVIEPFTDKMEREIAPLFESIARLMADLCARYSTRELAVVRDFIASVHQGAYEQIQKLREGDGRAERAKGSRPTTSA